MCAAFHRESYAAYRLLKSHAVKEIHMYCVFCVHKPGFLMPDSPIKGNDQLFKNS